MSSMNRSPASILNLGYYDDDDDDDLLLLL